MGTIKDITDLTIELINSVKDRKLTSKITQIQSLIGTFQSEQFAMVEKNTELLTENFNLKQEISDLKNAHTELELRAQTLASENVKLKSENNQLTEKVKELEKRISDFHNYSDLDKDIEKGGIANTY